MKGKKKQIVWSLVSVALAFLSIWAVVGQSQEMSLADLWSTLLEGDPLWMSAAVLSMSGYIIFEGFALWYILRESGFSCRLREGITYAASDIYCAAITPSATGGQPACAWFMVRDGLPMGHVTAVLALNLIFHTFATMICGILSIFLAPGAFAALPILAKFLVIVGYVLETALAVLFIVLLGKGAAIERIGHRVVDWLHRKGWVERTEYWKGKVHDTLADYSSCVGIVRGKKKALALLLLFNLLQRVSQTMAASLVYLAQGGAAVHAGQVFAAQIYSSIGSMCMPVPGGMGIADYLLFCGLNSFMDREAALQLELVSRSCSFYLCVLLSLVIVLLGYARRHRLYFRLKERLRRR